VNIRDEKRKFIGNVIFNQKLKNKIKSKETSIFGDQILNRFVMHSLQEKHEIETNF